jgi:SAM-dependent methyltransferase
MSGAANHCSCGAETAPARLFDITSRTSSARSTLRRCAECGSLFPESLPRPPEAEREYDIGSGERAGWRRVARRLVDLTRRRYVERAVPATAIRILDFGCGAGGYLAAVAVEGREAFGVDPIRPAAIGKAWRWIAVDDMERFAPFDWITLGHVLEHLDDPAGVLSRLAGLLAPGGGLWLATPNADSFIFEVAEAAARDIDYPRHREIFARAGLERVLETVGFSVTWVSAPRVNAILNVATTAGQMRPGQFTLLMRTWLALAMHLLTSRTSRDAKSPELIALCRIRAADPFPAR